MPMLKPTIKIFQHVIEHSRNALLYITTIVFSDKFKLHMDRFEQGVSLYTTLLGLLTYTTGYAPQMVTLN